MKQRYSYGRHSYPLLNFLKSLCVAQQKKQSQFIYYKFTKLIEQHVRFLHEQGYIAGYHYGNISSYINFVVIDLRYTRNKIPLIRRVHFFSSPSRFWYIRLRTIRSLVTKSFMSCYVVSTSCGIKTVVECSMLSISGMLLYKLN